MTGPTLRGRERSISQRVVDGADQQSHVLVSRAVHCPLAAGHVHVVVQAFDAVHHRLSRCLNARLLGQLCCYHGNNFLQQTAGSGRQIGKKSYKLHQIQNIYVWSHNLLTWLTCSGPWADSSAAIRPSDINTKKPEMLSKDWLLWISGSEMIGLVLAALMEQTTDKCV